jgi:cytidine deaminase
VKDDLEALVAAAKQVRARAYAPYSRYRVGAALRTKAGHVYVGCNVENSTFGATICAERSAVAAMVSAGDRDPVACVVVTAGPQPGSPCGICRQVLSEFAPDMKVVMIAEDPSGKEVGRKSARLSALLPLAFRLEKAPRRRASK